MSEQNLEHLSLKLNQLIAECERLRRENGHLQEREQVWLVERTQSIEKSDLARTRVEDMINHLKSMKEGAV